MSDNKTNWMVIVGLIVVGLVGYFLWVAANTDDVVEPDVNDINETSFPAEGTDIPENTDDPDAMDSDTMNEDITSLDEILNTTDQTTLVDSTVNLTAVPVLSVASDRVFFVGDSTDQSMAVLLDEDLSPESETEGQVNIQAGQSVSLTGVIRETPSENDIANLLGITQADIDALLGNDTYLFVQGTDVEIE